MKDNKKRTVISYALTASMLLLSLTACISASKVYELAFRNAFNTGSVAIDLRQEQIDEDGIKCAAEERTVMPGEHVSYMPEVENLRADAYVRVRIDINMENETSEPVTADNVFTVSDNWIQKGDYFYNKEVMKKGDVSIAFQGISVPDNWTMDPEQSVQAVTDGKEPAAASSFTITAHADAIQAANFHPDFSSDKPWGPVVTEEAKGGDKNTYSVAKTLAAENEMTFSGDAGLEANTRDLFRNFRLYMAGDEYKDTLKITNEATDPVTIYFRTNTKGSDMNDKMKLRIAKGSEQIYEGNITSERLSEFKELVRLDPGKSIDLEYTVTLPDDSKKAFSVMKDDTEWIFKAVVNNTDDHGKDHEKGKGLIPKTGEGMKLYLWLSLFGISVILLILVIDKGKKVIEEKNR